MIKKVKIKIIYKNQFKDITMNLKKVLNKMLVINNKLQNLIYLIILRAIIRIFKISIQILLQNKIKVGLIF